MKTEITTEQITEREKKAIKSFIESFKRACLIYPNEEHTRTFMEDYEKIYFQNHYEL